MENSGINDIMYSKNIEPQYIEIAKNFLDVYINTVTLMYENIKKQSTTNKDNVKGFVVTMLRSILVLLDGIKALFVVCNTEASIPLIRNLLEIIIQLKFFFKERKYVEENLVAYNLCYDFNYNDYVRTFEKYEQSDKYKSSILDLEMKYKEQKDIYALKMKNKTYAWYSVVTKKRGRVIKNLRALSKILHLNDKTYEILYDLVYKRASGYIHGQQSLDFVYSTDDFRFLSIRSFKSSSLYLQVIHWMLSDLICFLYNYFSLYDIQIMEKADVDELNEQGNRLKILRELDNVLQI